ncbi:hypothetical protein EMCRGX_G014694 [Ephydatia muelleri]
METITANYQAFMANGGIRKDAMEYRNCISEPLFNIPISQLATRPLPPLDLASAYQHINTHQHKTSTDIASAYLHILAPNSS